MEGSIEGSGSPRQSPRRHYYTFKFFAGTHLHHFQFVQTCSKSGTDNNHNHRTEGFNSAAAVGVPTTFVTDRFSPPEQNNSLGTGPGNWGLQDVFFCHMPLTPHPDVKGTLWLCWLLQHELAWCKTFHLVSMANVLSPPFHVSGARYTLYTPTLLWLV